MTLGYFSSPGIVNLLRSPFIDYAGALPEWLVDIAEGLLIIIAALVVNSKSRRRYKLLAIAVPLLFFAVLGYVFMQNLGVFFEFLLPMVVIAGHFSIDKILEWRRLAHAK